MLSLDMAEIVVEPMKYYRFRYKCEYEKNKSFPINGTNSSATNKSFITLKVNNFQGRFKVLVTCVTKNRYQQHPYRLVGKHCENGFFQREIKNGSTIVFDDLSIQRVKVNEFIDSLNERKLKNIDPYNRGFDRKKFDNNCVRLCFEVFLCEANKTIPHRRLVSIPICNKNNLIISKISTPSSTVAGNESRILLCGKVTKDDIVVQFLKLNEKTGKKEWKKNATIDYIHKNVAIVFRTPWCPPDIHRNDSIKCFIQLYRRSDDCKSERLEFEYHYEMEKARKMKRLDTNVAANFPYNPLANESDSTYCRPSTSQAAHVAQTVVSHSFLHQSLFLSEFVDKRARIKSNAPSYPYPIDSVTMNCESDSFDSISSDRVSLIDITPSFNPNKLDNNN